MTDQFGYGPYGEAFGHTGASDTPFRFNGRFGVQTDSNGLLYMRARYYNPAIRRFVNQDVLFGDINPGISLNRYAYANGNPISLMDPFGLCAQSDDSRFDTDPLGNPVSLEGWKETFNDLTNGWNAYLAWTQGNSVWINKNLPWLGNFMNNLAEAAKYAPIGEMSAAEGAMPALETAAETGAGETLALPAPRQVDYSWGAMNTYREGGQMTAIEHINYRHAFDSGFSNVSNFAEGTSASDIQAYVDQASRYGTVTPQGANGFKLELNLQQTIGTNQTGGAANGIRVFIRNGQVQTAFPVTFP